MCHSFFSVFLKPKMSMKELPFKSIFPILSSISSKIFLTWKHFMWYVENSAFDSPCIVSSLTISWKFWIPTGPSSSGSESWYYLNKNNIPLTPRSCTGIFFNLWPATMKLRKRPAFKCRFSWVCCINETTLIVSMQNI